MQSRFSFSDGSEHPTHLIVEAEPNASLEAVADAIEKTTRLQINLGSQDPSLPWGFQNIVDGALTDSSLAPQNIHGATPHPDSILLAQVSGEGAGNMWELQPGQYTVGSDERCDLHLTYDGIPATAAIITVSAEKTCTVEQTTATSTLLLEGRPVEASQAWSEGNSLRIGPLVFEILTKKPATASVTSADQPNVLDYNRPPRLMPKVRTTEFKYPSEPEPNSRGALPLLAMFVPLLLAIVMASVMQRPYFLIFGLMSPVMLLASFLSNRKNGKVTYREKKAKYRKIRAQIDADMQVAVTDFANEQRAASPDPATAGLTASLPTPRLWERRRDDPDHLSLRIGVSTVESDVTIYHPEELDHRRTQHVEAQEVPVTLSLLRYGVIGICGPSTSQVKRNAAWIVGQLAVTQSPRDVELVVLTDTDSADWWEWVRWLPHAVGVKGSVARIGNDTRTVGQRINELSQVLDQRIEKGEEKDPTVYRAIVTVFDGVRKLRQWPGAARLLAEGPAYGLYAVCLDSEERFLPEEAHAIVVAEGSHWAVKRDRAAASEFITPDLPESAWFEWVGRSLAPLRDASDESGSSIPRSARFLNTVDMPDPTPEDIAARWALSPRSTAAVIGESFDGAFDIDIRKDGPHALIAGTTGSGKSELLQTLIASLALRNRPDELTFVLIDYKGNAAFKDFVNLPHTVGIVTDLDGHLVQRAMESLAAELRRREHLLASIGAKDIEDFTAARERGETSALMPRLLLVIDEFAALKAELPEFVAGIVNIAQRGRSLGIHLVMATQRPQGAITADILANTNLRIALRMADAMESKDVIGTDDAADISTDTPGRAYVKSGSSPLLPFQSSRIGGARPTEEAAEVPEPTVFVVPWESVGSPLPPQKKQKQSESAVTDLQVLVAAMTQAAQNLSIARQPSPWLQPLGQQVTLDQLQDIKDGKADESLPQIPLGLQDFPEDQSQRPAVLDFEELSHLFIVGSPRTGRTQTLRTIAGSIASRVSADDVHIYGIDFGNGGLQGLLQLPHCNTVISRNQGNLLTRFIAAMERELATRRMILAQGGFASIVEQRKNVVGDEQLPHIVILFDQWEGFITGIGDNGQSGVGQSVLALLREASSAGIHLIIAGDRSLLSTRTNTLVEHKLMLRLADRSDYSTVGLSPRELPEKIGVGRAFEAATGRETQIALLAPSPTSQAQVAALQEIAQHAVADGRGGSPARVPRVFKDLASTITYAELIAEVGLQRPFSPLLGIGGDDVEPVAVDLTAIPTFAVGGTSRSGKSTALMALTRSSLEAGIKVVLMTPLRSPLQTLSSHENVLAYYAGADITVEAVKKTLQEHNLLLVVDDASAITDFTVLDELKRIGGAISAQGLRVLVADGAEDLERVGALSWLNEVVKRRHGLVLDPPTIFSGKPMGLALTHEILAQPRPVGRALVNLGDGKITTVQIAYEA